MRTMLSWWLGCPGARDRGGVIGGRVSLGMRPDALRHLCRGPFTVLVTGTNGKTTTTRMLAAAVAGLGAPGPARGCGRWAVWSAVSVTVTVPAGWCGITLLASA